MIIIPPCLLYYKMILNCQWHLLASTKLGTKVPLNFDVVIKKYLTSQWKSKQPIPETQEVTCTRGTIMGFVHEMHMIWVISPGGLLWLVYFRSLHICKSYHINAKYMINKYNKFYICYVVTYIYFKIGVFEVCLLIFC